MIARVAVGDVLRVMVVVVIVLRMLERVGMRRRYTRAWVDGREGVAVLHLWRGWYCRQALVQNTVFRDVFFFKRKEKGREKTYACSSFILWIPLLA